MVYFSLNYECYVTLEKEFIKENVMQETTSVSNVTDVLTKTFQDILIKIAMSLLSGAFVGLVSGLIVLLILKLFSRFVIPIPRKIIWSIVEAVMAFVTFYLTMMFYLKIYALK